MEGAPKTGMELRDPELRTAASPGSLRRAKLDEDERRDDRVETVVIAISLVLLITGLAAIAVAILLSRPIAARIGLVDQPDVLNDRKPAAPTLDGPADVGFVLPKLLRPASPGSAPSNSRIASLRRESARRS
jgi:hypothetical protein